MGSGRKGRTRKTRDSGSGARQAKGKSCQGHIQTTFTPGETWREYALCDRLFQEVCHHSAPPGYKVAFSACPKNEGQGSGVSQWLSSELSV